MVNVPAQHLFFLFFLFCMVGWAQESLIESLYHRKPINRGFLHGPYIPIYGVGGLLILNVCTPFESNGFAVFIVGLLACTTLEYFVGWLMETIFKKQFWDYSMLKFTYKNRISLLSSLFWGVMSLFVVYIVKDIANGIYNSLPISFSTAYVLMMMVAMSVDIIATVQSQIKLKERLQSLSYEQVKRILAEKRLEISKFRFKKPQFINKISELKLAGLSHYRERDSFHDPSDINNRYRHDDEDI